MKRKSPPPTVGNGFLGFFFSPPAFFSFLAPFAIRKQSGANTQKSKSERGEKVPHKGKKRRVSVLKKSEPILLYAFAS